MNPLDHLVQTRPWEDQEVSGSTKFLAVLFLAFLPLVLIFILLPLLGANTSIIGILVGIVFVLAVVFVWWRLLRRPSRFIASYDDPVPVDKLGEPFEVKFYSLFPWRTYYDRGTVRFYEKYIQIDGKLPPSPILIIGVFVVVGILPLILFKFGLGIIPAIIIAYLLGSKKTSVYFPYDAMQASTNGKTIYLKSPNETPSRFKFRLDTDDGERFYRELESHLPRQD